MRAGRKGRRGLTLVELIVSFTILLLLTSMAVPLARFKVRREKEKELRWALRELKTAIDKYKDLCDYGQLAATELSVEAECYPKNLEVLVEGVKKSGSVDQKIRFLRRVPRDPFTGSTEWGLRSSKDDPQSTGWGGQNVFDVYSKTYERAADGTPYSEW
jgi:general secretion pathway protein G